LTLMSSCDRDCGVGAIVVCVGCASGRRAGLRVGGEASEVVEGVWRWVTGQLSYSVRASASGCWWGTYGVGQEQLGPWWCNRRENEVERLASRGRNTSPARRVLNAPTSIHA
jgi:hypothetical protein